MLMVLFWGRYEPPCTGLAKEGQGYLSLSNPEQNKLCAGQPTGVQIVDRVLLPSTLPAGDYVLGWVRDERLFFFIQNADNAMMLSTNLTIASCCAFDCIWTSGP